MLKPDWSPNTSNTGYALLASIVEKVSGQSFKNFMSHHIYQPLLMKRTQVYLLEDDKLFAEGRGQVKHQLFPESLELFFRKDRDYKTKFVKILIGKTVHY